MFSWFASPRWCPLAAALCFVWPQTKSDGQSRLVDRPLPGSLRQTITTSLVLRLMDTHQFLCVEMAVDLEANIIILSALDFSNHMWWLVSAAEDGGFGCIVPPYTKCGGQSRLVVRPLTTSLRQTITASLVLRLMEGQQFLCVEMAVDLEANIVILSSLDFTNYMCRVANPYGFTIRCTIFNAPSSSPLRHTM